MTAVISSSVAENALCWDDGRKKRDARAIKPEVGSPSGASAEFAIQRDSTRKHWRGPVERMVRIHCCGSARVTLCGNPEFPAFIMLVGGWASRTQDRTNHPSGHAGDGHISYESGGWHRCRRVAVPAFDGMLPDAAECRGSGSGTEDHDIGVREQICGSAKGAARPRCSRVSRKRRPE